MGRNRAYVPGKQYFFRSQYSKIFYLPGVHILQNPVKRMWRGWILLPSIGYIKWYSGLKIERFYRWTRPNHSSPLKAEFPLASSRRGSQGSKAERLKVLFLAWSWRGPLVKTFRWPLGAESSLCWQPTRKQGFQSYNHEELNSANNKNELRNGFFPSAFRWEPSLVNTLMLALWYPEQ